MITGEHPDRDSLAGEIVQCGLRVRPELLLQSDESNRLGPGEERLSAVRQARLAVGVRARQNAQLLAVPVRPGEQQHPVPLASEAGGLVHDAVVVALAVAGAAAVPQGRREDRVGGTDEPGSLAVVAACAPLAGR